MKKKKKESESKSSWDTIKYTNIYFMGVPEAEKKKELNFFAEIMSQNFPNLM